MAMIFMCNEALWDIGQDIDLYIDGTRYSPLLMTLLTS